MLELYIYGVVVVAVAVIGANPDLNFFERIAIVLFWFIFIPARIVTKVMK